MVICPPAGANTILTDAGSVATAAVASAPGPATGGGAAGGSSTASSCIVSAGAMWTTPLTTVMLAGNVRVPDLMRKPVIESAGLLVAICCARSNTFPGPSVSCLALPGGVAGKMPIGMGFRSGEAGSRTTVMETMVGRRLIASPLGDSGLAVNHAGKASGIKPPSVSWMAHRSLQSGSAVVAEPLKPCRNSTHPGALPAELREREPADKTGWTSWLPVARYECYFWAESELDHAAPPPAPAARTSCGQWQSV